MHLTEVQGKSSTLSNLAGRTSFPIEQANYRRYLAAWIVRYRPKAGNGNFPSIALDKHTLCDSYKGFVITR